MKREWTDRERSSWCHLVPAPDDSALVFVVPKVKVTKRTFSTTYLSKESSHRSEWCPSHCKNQLIFVFSVSHHVFSHLLFHSNKWPPMQDHPKQKVTSQSGGKLKYQQLQSDKVPPVLLFLLIQLKIRLILFYLYIKPGMWGAFESKDNSDVLSWSILGISGSVVP